MIQISNVGVLGWQAAVRGMRNPMNSWSASDSDGELLGEKDLELAMKLSKSGTDHRKFMRMIIVQADILAPLYVWSEIDTYKVGTVRNSCSFMHKGVAKPFSINDFSVKDPRVYEVLLDYEPKHHELIYPYETNEYKIFVASNGRRYRVYRNGRVIREEFTYTDNYGTGRTRIIKEAPAILYQSKVGYYIVKLSGRGSGHMPLHRMVAEVWCDKNGDSNQVNHIDGNKGNNCAENLEWVTPKENVQKAIDAGLYDNLKSLRNRYTEWKNSMRILTPEQRVSFSFDLKTGMSISALSEKYDIASRQVSNIKFTMTHSEHEELFHQCYVWEQIITSLNNLRDAYLETKDETVFQDIRCLLPSGYLQKSTVSLNYEVLANMYRSRKNHRLDEWREFCKWIESLPYSELITEGA